MMNNLLAAFMFFTRIPFWKLKNVPPGSFRHIVGYWSLSGWLTGGTMAVVFLLTHLFVPSHVALVLALFSRLLLTGGLHEDGLADFCDGFGGGRDRESILRIMKDSHIGSYGVLGLIFYYLLGYVSLISLPVDDIPVVLLCADTFCKFVGSYVICLLPYARTESASKAKVVYTSLSVKEMWMSFAGGVCPLFLLPFRYFPALLFPVLVFICLLFFFRRNLKGYTGDCCGALFLVCELAFWLGAVIIVYN